MNRDDAVRDALKRLADVDSMRRAPPRLESAVLDAFDRARAQTASPRVAWRSWPAAAAVVAVIPLLVIAYRALVSPVPVGPTVSLPAHRAAPAPLRGVAIDPAARVGQIVQLRVPRSYLPLLGIPIVETEAAGSVNVQLLLTEDGQATSIRIVR